jgi:stage V sporulation protein D (sporulation-specific penicillin-binding protein)
MKKKMAFVLAFVFVAGFIVLVGRLIKLQFVDGGYYQKKALSQQLKVTKITANRGTIYDRNLKPLAQSATVWDVSISPSYIKGDKKETLEQKRKKISTDLASLLSLDVNDVYKKVSMNTGYVVLAKKVENDVASLVRAYKTKNNDGFIGLAEDSKRYYPFGSLCAQVLGFMGTDTGLAGIEAKYDSTLRGVDGRVVSAKNAKGTDMPYDYQDRVEAKDGTNLVLTIDEVVQSYLEKSLKSAYYDNNVGIGVTGIVMNVKTGEIVAMGSYPTYDPNNPYAVSDTKEVETISKLTGKAKTAETTKALITQWRNKAITNPYEPGSTYKIITSAACINEGVVKESDSFFDSGSIKVKDTTFHCWKHGGHGAENFIQAFENSCNPVFIQIGLKLGATKTFNYFSAFGLANKTGIDLKGEAKSIYYTGKQMGDVELASVSFGQSNKITPIQLITAVSAVANGGKLVQPHSVKEEMDSSGNVVKTFGTTVKRQVISAESSKRMCSIMENEVNNGTGRNAYVAGYRIGGKTGTSQKLDEKNSKSLITSFVGIAPADDPQYALLIMCDDPHASVIFASTTAAPAASKVFSEILPYLGVEAKYTAQEEKSLDVKTPNVVGQTVAAAEASLTGDKLKVSIKGRGGKVTAQIPESGNPIPQGGRVILYTGTEQSVENVTIPDFSGLTPAEVNERAAELGLNIEYSGNSDSVSKAYAQSIKAGTKVAEGTVITVTFRNETITVE